MTVETTASKHNRAAAVQESDKPQHQRIISLKNLGRLSGSGNRYLLNFVSAIAKGADNIQVGMSALPPKAAAAVANRPGS